jgi:hypothetical protein
MTGWRKRLYVLSSIVLLLISASCKKEVVPPDIKDEPKFYTEGKLNGEPFNFSVGQNNYHVEPEAKILNIWNLFYLPWFTSTLTDGNDSFLVLLIGDEVASSRDVADEGFLNTTLAFKEYHYENPVTWPGVYINMKRAGKWYVTTTTQIPEAHFNILKSESYTPPGAGHSMRKVEVSFKCMLQNVDNSADQIVIEDGNAMLLFTYEVK